MTFPAPGPAPDINDPGTFESRAQASVEYFSTAHSIYLSMLNLYGAVGQQGLPFAASVTTATTAALTTGLSWQSMVPGLQIAFLPDTSNTAGAYTITVDGLAGVEARTRKGTVLPADFITAGTPVFGYFDGTYIILDRGKEIIVNGNETTTRWGDGRQQSVRTGFSVSGTTSVALIATWTYDQAFIAAPVVDIIPSTNLTDWTGGGGAAARLDVSFYGAEDIFATTADFKILCRAQYTATVNNCRVSAVGEWF